MIPRHPLPGTELTLPALALGSWHTWDRLPFAQSVALLRHAAAAGITMFDVGVYGPHDAAPPAVSDVLFGAILREAGLERSKILLSVKLWLELWGPQGLGPQLETALRRLGTGHTDLVVLGDLRRDDISLTDLVRDLARMADRGVIRAWGVNNWSAANIARLIDIAAAEGLPPPRLAQLKYSVARRAIPDGAPFAGLFDAGFRMQASDIYEGGILAGKTTPQREIGRDPGGIRARIVAAAEPLAALAQGWGTSAATVAMALALSHPACVNALFGATTPAQVDQALAAFALLDRIGPETLRAALEPLWCDRGIVNPEGP